MNSGTLTIECKNMTESVPLESHHVFTPHEILLLKLKNNGLEIIKETTRREAVLIHLQDESITSIRNLRGSNQPTV